MYEYNIFEDFETIINEYKSVDHFKCFTFKFGDDISFLIRIVIDPDEHLSENVMNRLLGLETLFQRLADLANERHIKVKIDLHALELNNNNFI